MAMVLLGQPLWCRRVFMCAAATASGGGPTEELLGNRCALARQPRRRRAP